MRRGPLDLGPVETGVEPLEAGKELPETPAAGGERFTPPPALLKKWPLGPTCVLGAATGEGSPRGGGTSPETLIAVSMRDLFPRYKGPLVNKNILFLECDGQPDHDARGPAASAAVPTRSGFLSDAVTSGVPTRGDSFTETASSGPSQKEAPLGLPLCRLGHLVFSRFL